MVNSQLLDQVENWIANDVSASDQKMLQELLNSAKTGDIKALAVLQDSFGKLLSFGTAGLRGEMSPGPNRMNLAVVSKTAWGIAGFAKRFGKDFVEPVKVVIGYDARFHSAEFAKRSAKIFLQFGFTVQLFREALPTPILAFALKNLDFDIGVMVTASHNPGKDNGYKVYLGGKIVIDIGKAAQLVAPFDKLIAEQIANAPEAKQVLLSDDEPEFVSDEIIQDYYRAAVEGLSVGTANLRIVASAMHGVGGKAQSDILKRLGFEDLHFVKEQEEPDPSFPTVAFPNPEEKGALDLAIALCNDVKADILLANDPDADRLAVGCYDKHLRKYRALTGDEIGTIFGYCFAKKYGSAGYAAISRSKQLANQLKMSSSIVSSRLLEQICNKYNIGYQVTLTGHKWINRVENLIFGYEEALGYNVKPQFVRDKDGLMAASLIACIAQELKLQNKNLIDLLDEIADEFGLYSQRQLSIQFNSSEKIIAMVNQLRSLPPKTLAGEKVIEIIDYELNPPKKTLKQNGLSIRTDKNTRVFVRPSGTEPKVKFYIETITTAFSSNSSEEMTKLRYVADQKLNKIANELQSIYGE